MTNVHLSHGKKLCKIKLVTSVMLNASYQIHIKSFCQKEDRKEIEDECVSCVTQELYFVTRVELENKLHV